MFGKKKCSQCGEKVNKDYSFCPYCKNQLEKIKDERDFGMLGKNDLSEFMNDGNIRLPSGINTIFNSLLKNLSKQMNELETTERQKGSKVKRKGIGISIYAPGDRPPEIKVTSYGNPEEQRDKKERKIKLPNTNSTKFAGLPKAEPKTSIRRFSDKVIYEIDLPGVKSIADISISQLENSIEVKALGKEKVYQKIIPISLPIKKYDFSRKKLVLELDDVE